VVPTLLNNDDMDSGYIEVLHEIGNDINKREGTVVVTSVEHGDKCVWIFCGNNEWALQRCKVKRGGPVG